MIAINLKSFKKFTIQKKNLISKFFSLNETKSLIKYKFNYGVVKIPDLNKKNKKSEDAFEVHEGMICVADGVGAWSEQGVDPSKYSNELCKNVKKEYLVNGHKYFYNPMKIFSEACSVVNSMGSSTFCMCILDLEKEYLHTLNIGDSGYILIRGNNKSVENPNKSLNNLIERHTDFFDIVFKTKEQQIYFNCPYQVGTDGNDPEDADTFVHKIEENDIIVLASDGLWDNLYENQILNIIKPFYEISPIINDLGVVAEILGETCVKYSINKKYESPFSVKSGGKYKGGKPDDITILVAQIVKN